jgi:hypothetical protein
MKTRGFLVLVLTALAATDLVASDKATRPGFAPPDADRREIEITATTDGASALAPIDAGMAAAEVYVGPYAHVAAGTGLRNTGYGTIRLRGTPDGARKKQAFLYLGVICEGTCPAKRTAKLNGAAVSLTLIGTDVEPCWTDEEAQAGIYRADVTAKIPAAIDADYKIIGVASGVKTGSDPDGGPVVFPLVEGATLVVIYSTATLTPGTVYIHHGASTISSGAVYTLPLDPAPTGEARQYTSFGGDGQISGHEDETWVGDESGTWYVAGPPGGLKTTDSNWSGDDGWYWDTHTHDLSKEPTREYIPERVDAYVVRVVPHDDCLVVAGHVLTAR